MMEKQGTHHLGLIAANVLSMVLMLVCLIGFFVRVAAGDGVNTDAASNDRVWNLGMIQMNYSSSQDNVWKLDFRSASRYFLWHCARRCNACPVAGTGRSRQIYRRYQSF